MDPVTQQLMTQLSGKVATQISKKLGTDEAATTATLSAAVPLLISALANNASQPEGAQALHTALANDHDGSILNNLSGYLKDPAAANGAGILGHVLGDQQSVVTQGLTKSTGMTSEQVGQLLQIAAPIVLGAVGKIQQQQKLNPDGLSQYLGAQQQQAKQSNPDLMGVVNSLLDTNNDGSALDEVIGIMGKLFAK
jgi:hypothetical protein